jgi:nucleotide-binding universal stress UspA family protein
MTPVNHMIALTDFSPAAQNAIDRGFRLAKITAARYTLVHALEQNFPVPLKDLLGTQAAAVQKKIAEETQGSLLKIAQAGHERHGVDALVKLLAEDAATEVPPFLASAQADLVLLGAQGAGMVQRLFVGSTALRLIRQADRPMLVVRQPATADYANVLMTIDFSVAAKKSIELTRLLAPKAKLILLHVFETPFEGKMQLAGVTDETINHYRKTAGEAAVKQLHQFATAAGLSPSDYLGLVHYGDPRRIILEEAQKQRADLIVMGKHQGKTAEAFLLGSVTQRVLDQSETDLLIVCDQGGSPGSPLTP